MDPSWVSEVTMENRAWKWEETPSIQGKVIVVTGGNTGLGYEAANVFAKKGATVVLACRSLPRGEDAKKKNLDGHPKRSRRSNETGFGESYLDP